MSFARRLMLYLWGCLIGTILMYVSWKYFLPEKAIPSWLPASLLVDRINKFPLQKSEKAKCLLQCYHITDDEINEIIKQKNIDYKNSERTRKPWPVFYFMGTTNNKQKIQLNIEVPDTLTATLLDMKIDTINCSCEY